MGIPFSDACRSASSFGILMLDLLTCARTRDVKDFGVVYWVSCGNLFPCCIGCCTLSCSLHFLESARTGFLLPLLIVLDPSPYYPALVLLSLESVISEGGVQCIRGASVAIHVTH